MVLTVTLTQPKPCSELDIKPQSPTLTVYWLPLTVALALALALTLTLTPRRVADGTLVYSLPLAPDARVPFVNPYASVGPVGAPQQASRLCLARPTY